jgi:hypothetical protein
MARKKALATVKRIRRRKEYPPIPITPENHPLNFLFLPENKDALDFICRQLWVSFGQDRGDNIEAA